MNRRTALAGMTAVVASAASQWNDEFAHQLVTDFMAHMKLTREYCLAFLEAMPDEHLGFKPTPEQLSFAEQLTHFCGSNTAYLSRFEKTSSQEQPERPKDLDRQRVRAFMEASFDYVDEVLAKLTEADIKRRDIPFGRGPRKHTAHDIFIRVIMHTAHHRGQAVCYLRLKGIEPPRWRFQANGEIS